jgi:hypothetical protein
MHDFPSLRVLPTSGNFPTSESLPKLRDFPSLQSLPPSREGQPTLRPASNVRHTTLLATTPSYVPDHTFLHPPELDDIKWISAPTQEPIKSILHSRGRGCGWGCVRGHGRAKGKARAMVRINEDTEELEFLKDAPPVEVLLPLVSKGLSLAEATPSTKAKSFSSKTPMDDEKNFKWWKESTATKQRIASVMTSKSICNLAQSYRGNLSDWELNHQKLFHLGRKQVQKVWPKTKVPAHCACDACIKGKIHAFPHKRRALEDKRYFRPGQRLEVDWSGSKVPSLSGNTGRYLFIDGCGMIWVWFCKSQTEFYEILPQQLAELKALTGRDLLVLKVDGSKVNFAAVITQLLLDNKVKRECQAPNDSNTLPTAEGHNRFMDEGSMAAIACACTPANTWPEANHEYAYVYNKAFLIDEEIQGDDKVVTTRRTSRYNLAVGQHLPFDHDKELHPWGCLIYMYILKKEQEGSCWTPETESTDSIIHGT